MVLSLITAGDNSALRVLVFLLYLTWKILEMRKNLEKTWKMDKTEEGFLSILTLKFQFSVKMVNCLRFNWPLFEQKQLYFEERGPHFEKNDRISLTEKLA